MRIAQLVVVAVPDVDARARWTSCPRASGARAASARRGTDGERAAHPGLGAPALARPDPALPAREAGQGVLAAARAAASTRASRSSTRCGASCRRRSGIDDPIPFEGPIAIVDSIAPVRSFAAKHVVHIIFSSDLGGRSLETVTSADAAVRGHRLFALGELDEIVLHPPIQRFLARWRPGRPDRLPRPPVGALAALTSPRLVDRRGTSPLSFLIRYDAPWQAHWAGDGAVAYLEAHAGGGRAGRIRSARRRRSPDVLRGRSTRRCGGAARRLPDRRLRGDRAGGARAGFSVLKVGEEPWFDLASWQPPSRRPRQEAPLAAEPRARGGVEVVEHGPAAARDAGARRGRGVRARALARLARAAGGELVHADGAARAAGS